MITIEIKKPGGSFVDQKANIEWPTVQIRQALTKEVDACIFEVLKFGNRTYIPEAEDEIQIKEDGVKIFAGFVVRVEEVLLEGYIIKYSVECKDYTHLLDRKLVIKSYTGQTIAAIISDIIANFSAAGLTTTNVIGTDVVPAITFDSLEPSKCFQKLADTYNRDWYIDYNKDVHFFSEETNNAPFSLSDTGGTYILPTLKITRDSTQIKNSIYVEGGEELSSAPAYDKWIGDAAQYSFKTSYKYKNYTLTVNAVSKTVGIDGINTFADGFDALYNFQTFTLRFPDTSPPAASAVIIFGGNYYFDITTLVRESNSITKYGEKQFKIIDSTITDRNLAKERAKAELFAYAAQLSEGEFQTYTTGLRAGQRIQIQSDLRGMAAEMFLINNLTIKLYTPDKTIWTANLVSVKTYDIIDLLSRIVDNSGFLSDGDKVLRTAELVLRTIKVQRLITLTAPYEINRTIQVGRIITSQLGFTPQWVAGTYVPTNPVTDPKRTCFANVGCLAT